MTPWVLRLLVANVAIFALQVVQPGFTDWFAFAPSRALRMPWTILSYAFVHGSPGHLFWNMLALFIFGPRVEGRLGGRSFMLLYLFAALTGAVFQAVLAPGGSMVGASGALCGVSLAYAAFWPRHKFYIWGIIGVEAWLLVSLYALWSVLSGVGGSRGGVADFAHLGGYVGGYLYLLVLQRSSPAARFKSRVQRVAPETERSLARNLAKVNTQGVHQLTRDEVDRILDKIRAEGIGSLTPQEKLFLSNFVPPDDRKDWVS